VSAAFGSSTLPWKPGHLRSAYGALCCHKFKPKNQTDDIFLAQILGHKLLGPNASLSVGQSYKDFYIGFTRDSQKGSYANLSFERLKQRPGAELEN
jgi:Telomere resolvase